MHARPVGPRWQASGNQGNGCPLSHEGIDSTLEDTFALDVECLRHLFTPSCGLPLSCCSLGGPLNCQPASASRQVAPFQRAMVPWAWIISINDEAFTRAEIPIGKMTPIVKKCLHARNGIQTIHTSRAEQPAFGITAVDSGCFR